MIDRNILTDFSGSMTFKTTYYDPSKIPPPTSLVINMTKLDEICERARGFKEIVLMVDGEDHRYKTEDVLEILREIEL